MNCDVDLLNIHATCTKFVLDDFVTNCLHKISNLCACSHHPLFRISASHASQACKENITKYLQFDNFVVILKDDEMLAYVGFKYLKQGLVVHI